MAEEKYFFEEYLLNKGKMAKMSLKKQWKTLSRRQRLLFIFTLLLLFYTVFGFFILPSIIRCQLETKLSRLLHRQTTVAEVKVNPYTLQFEINGFHVQDKESKDNFVAFDSLGINLQAVSVFKFGLVTTSISLINPSVNIALYKDLSWNFSDLLVNADSKQEAGEKQTDGLLFSLNNIEIKGGKVQLVDQVKGEIHNITDLHLALPYLSNMPSDVEIFVKPAFDAVINGTAIGMKGDTKPFHSSRQSEFTLNFRNIDLTRYQAYLPDDLGIIIESGLLDLNLSITFMEHEDGRPAVKIMGVVALREVDIRDRTKKPLISFPELRVEIDKAHIIRKEFHLADILFNKPVLWVDRLPDGSLNLSTIMAGAAEKEQPSSPDPKPLLLTLKEAKISGATINFSDRAGETPFKTILSPMDLDIKNYSSIKGRSADFILALTSESAEKISVKGAFSTLPMQAKGKLSLNNIKVDKYRPYYQGALAAKLKARRTDIRADFEFSENKMLLITDGSLDMEDISLAGERKQEEIIIPGLSVSGIDVDPTGRKLVISQCRSRDGVIPLFRRADGSLNVVDFLTQTEQEENLTRAQPDADQENNDKWLLQVKSIAFNNFSSIFIDQTPGQSARFVLDHFNFTAGDLSNERNNKGRVDLDLRLNKSMTAGIGGNAGLDPLSLSLDIAVKDLPFKAAQPYLNDMVNVIISSGSGGVTGTLSLAVQDDDVRLKLHGNVDTQNLSLLNLYGENILSWKKFDAKDLNITTSPLRIGVKTLAIDGLDSFISIDKDGRLNTANLIVAEEDNSSSSRKNITTSSAPPAPEPLIEIGRVKLTNSQLFFRDMQVSPPFNTSLHEIEGQVSGLSSGKDVAADINLTAKLDQYSPLIITGKIHPRQSFYTDFTVGLHDVDLTGMTPYTVKFIGYPLTKGKLNLDLHYQIKDKKLESSNKAFIDQITLGDFVKNDTATSLPVSPAIALLKNRAGEIELDIPVTGELDDPEFSVAGVIFTVIKNLLVKAATSPFALLGSLFPDNQDFIFVEFVPGSVEPVNKNSEELSALAGAMYDHPALKLEITGFFDPETDRSAMIDSSFNRQLKIRKFKDMSKQAQPIVQVDDVVINPEEYNKYLKKAYKAATFERPRNFLGLLKSLPPGEMKKLIYEHIVISDDDLQLLGTARAKVVKDYLIKNGPIEAERIFIVVSNKSAMPLYTAGRQSGVSCMMSVVLENP